MSPAEKLRDVVVRWAGTDDGGARRILSAIVGELEVTHGHRIALTIAASKTLPATGAVLDHLRVALGTLLEAATSPTPPSDGEKAQPDREPEATP